MCVLLYSISSTTKAKKKMKNYTTKDTRFQNLDLKIPEIFNIGLKQKLIKSLLFGNWPHGIKYWLFFPLACVQANHLTFLNLCSFLCHVFFFSFRNAEGSQVTWETFGAGNDRYTVSTHRFQFFLFWWRTWIKVLFFFLVFHDLLSKYLPEKEWKDKEGLRELDVSTFSESCSLPLPHLELAIRVRASTRKCEAESFWSFSFKNLDLILDWVSKKANVCPEQTFSLRQDGGRKTWDQAWRRRELPGPFLPKSLQQAY